ncbi:UbiA prenyltransferase family protein [Candidatus Uhrbacteria bacterium]|nr:UbiA prenyltransferase family protein [Candidatus Uhrbacteria bacterium]
MTAHLREAIWSLRVLWDHDGIVWPPDRIRLWWKSVHLYLSFLAFTDPHRPADQLRRTMVCAVLSAVYDYDSDWEQGRRDGRNFLALLAREDVPPAARAMAIRLFRGDVGRTLSEEGLERGSAALAFYRLVIDSAWMRVYRDDEIARFGRGLQLVDDLIDLDRDYLTGDANCFLLPDRAQRFADEARSFLGEEFFRRLAAHSRVYRSIDRMARKTLRRFGAPRPELGQLFAMGRPMTAGLYGLALPLASFAQSAAPWGLRILSAFVVTGLTMSIMVFNDWKDRHHDRKKGKLLASEHPEEVWRYWMRLNAATVVCIIGVAVYDVGTAAFCLGIWLVGVGYSFVPHWYLVQNILVAVCAGAPALLGGVWSRAFDHQAACTFFVLAALIFIGEVYKDIEDARIDPGYKATIPVRLGHVHAVAFLIAFIFVPAAGMALHPNGAIRQIAFAGLPFMMVSQAYMLLSRPSVAWAKWGMKWTVTAVLLVLLFAP